MAAHGPDAAPWGGGKGPAPSDQAKAPLSLVQQPLSPAWSPGAASAKPVAPSLGGCGPQREWSPTLRQARCPWGCG